MMLIKKELEVVEIIVEADIAELVKVKVKQRQGGS